MQMAAVIILLKSLVGFTGAPSVVIRISRSLKYESSRKQITILESLGHGSCLALRHVHLAYVVFVFCRLSRHLGNPV